MLLRCLLILSCSLALLEQRPLAADPAPGDIFREYLWRGPFVNASNWQRVTDPQAGHKGAQAFLPNPLNKIDLDDLDQAIGAEIYLELWGGHAGTSNKRLRLNGHDWIDIEEAPDIPGKAGALPAECYQQFRYPSVAIPLEQLRQGENTFAFTSGPQICFDFGWGQWGVYGVTFRIYYAATKDHPQGRVTAPLAGSLLGDSWTLSATASSATSAIAQVDFIGYYEDFDYEGNGRTRQWHYNYRYGRISRHLGTAKTAPFSLEMDATWVPDQTKPIQLMARIRDAAGINLMTAAIDGLHIQRPDRSIKLYLPHQVPASWQSRAGRRHRSAIFVADDLRYATRARMLLTTWSGSHAEAIGLNDSVLVPRLGKYHDYSYDAVPVPLDYLQQGTNTFFTFSGTRHHGIEVLWPGIALQVEYEGLAASGPRPHQDLAIYADAPALNWTVDNTNKPLDTFDTQLDIASSNGVFNGNRAIELRVPHIQWRLDLSPDVPLDTTGYRAVRFAFRKQEASDTKSGFLELAANNQSSISLLASELATPIDLSSASWQLLEIPLADLSLDVPYIESLNLSGAFTGTVFLDDIYLAASAPPTAVTPTRQLSTPPQSTLEQNFPNPFNSSTTFRFDLATTGRFELAIYNLAGQLLLVIDQGEGAFGGHTIQWDGRDQSGNPLASGMYLYRLQTATFALSRRLLLLR